MGTPKIISVVSQKGGVGKSTVSMLMADVLHHQGKKVVVVDTDPQKSAQKWESKTLEGYPAHPVFVEAVSGLRETEFAQWLEKRANGVDYFIIDTPPNLASRELRAALFIADTVVLPFIPHTSSSDALEELHELIMEVEQARGEEINVKVLLNKVDLRRGSARAIVANAATICPYPVLKKYLKDLASYADPYNFRTSFYSLSPSASSKKLLESVVKEVCK